MKKLNLIFFIPQWHHIIGILFFFSVSTFFYLLLSHSDYQIYAQYTEFLYIRSIYFLFVYYLYSLPLYRQSFLDKSFLSYFFLLLQFLSFQLIQIYFIEDNFSLPSQIIYFSIVANLLLLFTLSIRIFYSSKKISIIFFFLLFLIAATVSKELPLNMFINKTYLIYPVLYFKIWIKIIIVFILLIASNYCILFFQEKNNIYLYYLGINGILLGIIFINIMSIVFPWLWLNFVFMNLFLIALHYLLRSYRVS